MSPVPERKVNTMRLKVLVLAAVTILPAGAAAQSWKEIGKTTSGSMVSIDTKSVKRVRDSVSVVMRTRFAQPDGDGITRTRTVATFNCANEKVLVRENDTYAGTRLVKKSIPKTPGWGVVFGGSLTGVAYDYLCPKKP
jgi:hypothetical protein